MFRFKFSKLCISELSFDSGSSKKGLRIRFDGCLDMILLNFDFNYFYQSIVTICMKLSLVFNLLLYYN